MTKTDSFAAIILAAGMGTRMQSSLPKVLHEVAGRSMLGHVVSAAETAGADKIILVASPDNQAAIAEAFPDLEIAVQSTALGTAHAVMAARQAIGDFGGRIIVLYGDTPLVTGETIEAMLEKVSPEKNSPLAVSAFRPANPSGYGRMVVEDGQLIRIVEDKEASEKEKRISLCNGGFMAFAGRNIYEALDRIGNDNAKGEYYLTDIVGILRAEGGLVSVTEVPEEIVLGVDDRVKLSRAEELMQNRLREAAMRAGASLVAPQTVWFSHDTQLGRDVLVEPHVRFGPGVRIADGVTIKGFSHLEGCQVDAGADIGPYARLRPGAHICNGARIGNFVEVKNTVVEAGAKANHLAYLGDARVGAGANIGAGTITCNYDGYLKSRTDIGAGAFIGSNSALVAPVRIGDGAIVGAGSTVTTDVEADALSIARGRQQNKQGLARLYREKKAAEKAALKKK